MSNPTPSSNEEKQLTSGPAPIAPSIDQDGHDVRQTERHARNSGAWVGGVILIVLGVIFLLQNVRGFYLNNWWALFILIPALGSFVDAWNIYRQTGRLSRRGRSAIISGCVFLLVTATFLFNWNWGVVLPVLLIIWGATLLLNSLLPD